MVGSTFSSNCIAAVSVEIIFTNCDVERQELTIGASSLVSHVVDVIRSSIQVEGCRWTLDCEKVVVKHDGNTVDDLNVPVVDFSLDLPFSFCEHACLCASLILMYHVVAVVSSDSL